MSDNNGEFIVKVIIININRIIDNAWGITRSINGGKKNPEEEQLSTKEEWLSQAEVQVEEMVKVLG